MLARNMTIYHHVSLSVSYHSNNNHFVSIFLSVLNSISLTEKTKSKERCKFYPSCGKGDQCEFIHPSSPCKVFPNCKFGEKFCLYIHPKCKFDLTCTRLGCNFSHTAVISAAPPLCKLLSGTL